MHLSAVPAFLWKGGEGAPARLVSGVLPVVWCCACEVTAASSAHMHSARGPRMHTHVGRCSAITHVEDLPTVQTQL